MSVKFEDFVQQLVDLHNEDEADEEDHVDVAYIKNDASQRDCEKLLKPYVEGEQDETNFVKDMYSLVHKAKQNGFEDLASAIYSTMDSMRLEDYQTKNMVEAYDNDLEFLAQILAERFVAFDAMNLIDSIIEVCKYNDSLRYSKTLRAIKKMMYDEVIPEDEFSHLRKSLKKEFEGLKLDDFDEDTHAALEYISGDDLDTLGVLPASYDEEEDPDNVEDANYTPRPLSDTKEHNHLKEISEVEYHKLLPLIYALHKLAPVTVKDLERKEQKLSAAMRKLPEFKQFFGSAKAKQTPITKEFIQQVSDELKREGYKVEYGTWNSELQRSVEDKEQIVLSICADKQHLAAIDEFGKKIYDEWGEGDNHGDLPNGSNTSKYIFNALTMLSERKDHPYHKDQLGWVRITVADGKSYMLVDEIQSDFLRADFDMKSLGVVKSWANEKCVAFIQNLFKDFEHVAMHTAQQFARANGIKKIFYHTYEGGKELKGNEPPQHLYSEIPKSHFYKTTEDKPFKLPAQFFVKEARLLMRAAKLLLN